MGVLEAVLALIGLVALIGAVARWRLSESPVEPDLAAPYREGLEAAARIQAVALELEQRLYAEAMRHATDEPGSER